MTRHARHLTSTAAICAVALLAAGCGSSSKSPTSSHVATTAKTSTALGASAAHPGKGAITVAIRNFAYSPDHLYVTAGTTVSFHNYDQTQHTATLLSNSLGTGTIQPGGTGKIDFTKAGTYPYHCLFHAFMTGTVTVLPASS